MRFMTLIHNAWTWIVVRLHADTATAQFISTSQNDDNEERN